MKKIYLCGPTVYDYQHLGNIRPVIIMDFIIRSYISLGQEIYYVHNITDIDDKIIKKSIDTSTPEKIIAQKYTDSYLNILKSINIIMPNEMPNVTDNMESIINFIEIMIKNKSAYVKNGDVYFDILSIKGYGSVSNYKIINNLYKNINDNKKNQEDFVLWKKTKIGITWNSPWSKGRPGWHTECATFINKYFNNKSIDIHGGGIDLKFPHHENENIQYIAANKVAITKKWYHFGHLFLEDKKMSKSLNNIIRIDKFIEKYDTNILKIIFILTNPMSPMSINENIIQDAKKLNKKLEKIWIECNNIKTTSDSKKFDELIVNLRFSEALHFLHQEIKEFKNNKSYNSAIILNIINSLNLIYINKKENEDIKYLLEEWKKQKDAKNFVESDKLRDKLKKLNAFD